MPKKSYKCDTIKQKEKVLNLLYFDVSYVEIERKFGLDEATQRKQGKNWNNEGWEGHQDGTKIFVSKQGLALSLNSKS